MSISSAWGAPQCLMADGDMEWERTLIIPSRIVFMHLNLEIALAIPDSHA